MRAALEGIRVLELGQWIAAPSCSAILSDLGADVIKSEKLSGDDQRGTPPHRGALGATFATVNRNKRSIALDFRRAEDCEALVALASQADVVIENYRPGTLAPYGLDYTTLSRLNPTLIYCSISGFGQTGPLARTGAFDIVAQAMSGLMALNGPTETKAWRLPMPIADVAAGLYAAIGILAALQGRAVTGVGQQVDVTLLESALSFGFMEASSCLMTGEEPHKLGAFARNAAPYQVFAAQDRTFVVAAAGQELWTSLCRCIGRTELLEDERFSTPALRLQHNGALEHELAHTLATRKADDWLALLAAASIPSAPILSIAEVLEHEQLAAQQAVVPVRDTEVSGAQRILANPVHLSGTPLRMPSRAPLLDEHRDAVLQAVRERRWPTLPG